MCDISGSWLNCVMAGIKLWHGSTAKKLMSIFSSVVFKCVSFNLVWCIRTRALGAFGLIIDLIQEWIIWVKIFCSREKTGASNFQQQIDSSSLWYTLWSLMEEWGLGEWVVIKGWIEISRIFNKMWGGGWK